MLKLFVENPNASQPTATVGWCVDKEIIDRLKRLGVVEPFLFILVVHLETGRQDRRIVPLSSGLEFIQFRASGRHRIFAAIVWSIIGSIDTSEAKGELRRFFLDRGRVVVEADLTRLDIDLMRIYGIEYISPASIDVVVADGFFAKKPGPWEEWWLSLCFETEMRDECSLRWRRFVAYVIMPIPVLIYLAFVLACRTVFAITAVLCGFRADFSAIVHPFTQTFVEVASFEAWNNYCTTKKTGELRAFGSAAFAPAAIVPVALGAFIILKYVSSGMLGISIMAALFAALYGYGYWRIKTASERELRSAEAKRKRREETVARERAEHEELVASIGTKLAALSCGGVPPLRVADLPPERRTFVLRFQDLKAKICRPFEE